jgi:hypothetical protein
MNLLWELWEQMQPGQPGVQNATRAPLRKHRKKHTQTRIKQQTDVTHISLRILRPTPTKHPTYHYNDLINTLDQNWN